MGVKPEVTTSEFNDRLRILSPYGAYINLTIAGTVRYTNGLVKHPQMCEVSSFIRSWTNKAFYGTRMMVAEWNSVRESKGNSVSKH